MLPQQKESVLTLIVWGIGSLVLAGVLTFATAYRMEITYVLMVLIIMAMWVCRRLTGVRWKKLDERYQGIRFKAGMAGAAGVVTLVVVSCLILSSLFRSAGAVPVFYLALMAFGAMASLYLFTTITILLLYRKGG